MKSGKQHLTDGMELANQEKIRMPGEKETYKYLGVLEGDTIKQEEIKEKIKKEYLMRTRKLYSRNLIKWINTWALPLVRYSRLFLKWTTELKLMDQKTRKPMSIYKAFHSRDDVDWLYVSRKEGGRALTSIKDSVDATIQRLEDFKEKHGKRLITVTRKNTDNTKNNRKIKSWKRKWEEKQPYGRFKRLRSNIPHKKT